MLSAQACIISAPVISRFMARQTLSENKSEIWNQQSYSSYKASSIFFSTSLSVFSFFAGIDRKPNYPDLSVFFYFMYNS